MAAFRRARTKRVFPALVAPVNMHILASARTPGRIQDTGGRSETSAMSRQTRRKGWGGALGLS